jgi:membrane protein DedA with SNARE-associated domain
MNKIIQFILLHGYWLLFLWSFLAQFGLPIPAAPLFFAAGALAGMGEFNLFLILLVAISAILISDVLWYEIGRYRGHNVLSWLCRISLDPDSCVHSSESMFSRHGTHSLLISKFIPGINTVTPPLAGIFHMRRAKFFFFDGLGIIIFVGSFASIGYLLGAEAEKYFERILNMGGLLSGILMGALVAFILFKYFRRRQSTHKLAVPRIAADFLKRRIADGEDLLIVDVRSDLDVESDPFTLPGAYHIPLEQIKENPHVFPSDREIVLYCS